MRESDLQKSARVIRMAAAAAESHRRDVRAAPSTARALADVLEELDALRAGMQRIRAICKSPKSIRHRAGALVEIEAIAASTAPNAERDRHA